MSVCVNEQYISDSFDKLDRIYKAAEFDEKNRYAMLRKTVIGMFIRYGREDLKNGQYERAVYVSKILTRFLEENGSLQTWYETPDANGAKMCGYSMINNDGRPVFYCGFGHFEQVKKDIPNMQKLGCNTIQIEIGPSNVLFPIGEHDRWGMDKEPAFSGGESYIYQKGEFEINLSYLKTRILPYILQAEKENVAVCLLLSPHYIPRWFLEKYPDLKSKNVGFLKYNIYHPKAREMIDAYLDAILPHLKNLPALSSICISNEPAFNTMCDCSEEEVQQHELLPTADAEKNPPGTNMLDKWHEYLGKKYKRIENLCAEWGKDYSGFRMAGMPEKDDDAHFYTWQVWNEELFADWHRRIAEKVKSCLPEIPVHAKFMPVFGTIENEYHRRFLKYGVDPEMFSEFCDFSGNDAWSFEGRAHLPLSYKLEWYDFLASLKRAPIDNSEDHIIEDRDGNYSPVQAQRIYADMWQGAVHGRTFSQIWVWERTNNPGATANGSILHRPDCVEAVGRASLDLNRLAFEVQALQNCKREAAILFSKPSRVYNREYTAALHKTYEGLIFSGIRPYFITEKNISELNGFGVLAVPEAANVYRETADEIERFMKNGGNVIFVSDGKKLLSADENNIPLEEKKIFTNAYRAECTAEAVKKTVSALADREITVETEGKAEWCTADYCGKKLINICSYESKTVAARITGAESLRDLISGRVFSADEIELEPYVPVLLEIK